MRNTLFCLLFSVSIGCFGQTISSYQPNAIFESKPNGYLSTLPPPPKEKVENVYLHENWVLCDIFFKDGTKLGDQQIKIELLRNNIEVQYKDQVMVLPVSKVSALYLKNGREEEYINGYLLKNQGLLQDQLLKVIYNGKVNLLSQTIVTIVEVSSDPNPMLNNPKEDRVKLKKKNIIAFGQDAIVVESKSKLKSALLPTFGPEVEELVKKVSVRDESELVQLVKDLEKLAQ
jgi:hypothetical protein